MHRRRRMRVCAIRDFRHKVHTVEDGEPSLSEPTLPGGDHGNSRLVEPRKQLVNSHLLRTGLSSQGRGDKQGLETQRPEPREAGGRAGNGADAGHTQPGSRNEQPGCHTRGHSPPRHRGASRAAQGLGLSPSNWLPTSPEEAEVWTKPAWGEGSGNQLGRRQSHSQELRKARADFPPPPGGCPSPTPKQALPASDPSPQGALPSSVSKTLAVDVRAKARR